MTKLRLPEQNSVVIVGRLTQDPEIRYTQKGQAVCRFTVAVNRSYRDANGEWQKEVSFIPIVSWRDVALQCSEHLKKGSPVHITGRLKSRKWEDKNGQSHNTLEVETQRVQFLQLEDTEKIDEKQDEKNISEEQIPSQMPEEQDEPF